MKFFSKVKMTGLVCLFLMGAAQLTAQQDATAKFKVMVSNDRLKPGDTLELNATYSIGERKLPPATLDVLLKQEDGPAKWRMRWPLLEGQAMAAIVIPPNFPEGIYRLFFAVQPRFFRVYGQVASSTPIEAIEGLYLDQFGKNQPVVFPVNRGRFEWKDFYFENQAKLIIDETSFKRLPPITIETWLDSVYTPVAFNAKAISIGKAFEAETLFELSVNEAKETGLPFFDINGPYNSLKEKFPQWTEKQYFDSLYVSEAFKTTNPLVYDCLSNPDWEAARDLEAYLQKVEPTFRLQRWTGSSTPSAQIEKADYLFYINEQPATLQTMGRLTKNDLAQIRIFTPADPTNKKSQGRIALYTRRGPFVLQDPYYHNWKLKGYQPYLFKLPVKPVGGL